ncbi:MAG: glycosyltransferase family 4 protein [Chitinophagaceae bacterium]|nr:glycosyltransferase family 4 protein [Chitinophagaceae bacterium]
MFLTLTTFSSTGGIEKFNRAFVKVLLQLQSPLLMDVYAAGMYDRVTDPKYAGKKNFHPFYGNRIKFVFKHFFLFFKTDELILGHLNLAILGRLFKMLFPQKKLTVICHGIEVFNTITAIQKKALQSADVILAVSHFTKLQLVNRQGVDEKKITVFPNTIDPYFQMPQQFEKPAYLLKRYRISAGEKVLFTLTRLNSEEGYKGYDKILHILPALVKKGIQFKYILAGKADAHEKEKVQQLIQQLDLGAYVLMPGYIKDEEITDHYLLADVFVMPSKGEGFGIVYLEAMACGLPVIAGNKDGSTEALQFGELGTLVDPDDESELYEAIKTVLQEPKTPEELQQKMLSFFSFERYTERLQQHMRA